MGFVADNRFCEFPCVDAASDQVHRGCPFESLPVARIERVPIPGNIENDDFRVAPMTTIKHFETFVGRLFQLPQFACQVGVRDEVTRVRRELHELTQYIGGVNTGCKNEGAASRKQPAKWSRESRSTAAIARTEHSHFAIHFRLSDGRKSPVPWRI